MRLVLMEATGINDAGPNMACSRRRTTPSAPRLMPDVRRTTIFTKTMAGITAQLKTRIGQLVAGPATTPGRDFSVRVYAQALHVETFAEDLVPDKLVE